MRIFLKIESFHPRLVRVYRETRESLGFAGSRRENKQKRIKSFSKFGFHQNLLMEEQVIFRDRLFSVIGTLSDVSIPCKPSAFNNNGRSDRTTIDELRWTGQKS